MVGRCKPLFREDRTPHLDDYPMDSFKEFFPLFRQ